jgi:hypothetical protein
MLANSDKSTAFVVFLLLSPWSDGLCMIFTSEDDEVFVNDVQ